MFIIPFLKGLFVGLVVSVPTGPIGFLTVKRSVNDGFWSGFFTGLGAVASDLVYGMIIIIGMRNATLFFETYKNPISLFGGILLVVMGVVTYLSKRKNNKEIKSKVTYLGQFITSFLITMLNPMQIIAFTALMGSMSVFHGSFNLSVVFLIGLLVGSLIWWTSLSFVMSKIKNSFNENHILFVNKIAGVVIGLSGIFILMQLFGN